MPTETAWDIELSELDYGAWRARLEEIGEETGFFEPLGARHHALFDERGDTLLVSFESFAGITALDEKARPIALPVAEAEDWSLLSVVSKNDTWFRDGAVFGFFDQLTDDGFFDDFDRVVFYGAGPCGYAAAAFSVSAPGAVVVAAQPQATLDPRLTNWDERFTEYRRMDFTDRYGYAPDMLDAALRAYVLVDPRETLDAMHAALFHREGVTRLPMPFMGATLQTALIDMELLGPVLRQAADGTLDALSFARMMRARRDYGPYLRRLLARVEADERLELTRLLCANVASRKSAPRFRRRLRALRRIETAEAEAEAGHAAEDAADIGPDGQTAAE
ncbi:phosphoadenosine phosphosulfate reductase [Roseivivax lentus]|nr:phosphoadenosine phosphosulfate reductase [Roseivivax lentus]